MHVTKDTLKTWVVKKYKFITFLKNLSTIAVKPIIKPNTFAGC
jgi:hypothetical protein